MEPKRSSRGEHPLGTRIVVRKRTEKRAELRKKRKKKKLNQQRRERSFGI
jgi:hypothetical protein